MPCAVLHVSRCAPVQLWLARLDGKYGAYETGVDRLNALLARLMIDKRARPAWIGGAMDNLGQMEFTAGRYRKALEGFDAAHAYCQKSSDPRGIQCIYTQYNRSLTLMLLGNSELALDTVAALLDSSRISESSAAFATRFTRQAFHVLLENGHPRTQLVSLHRVRALWAVQRREEALAVIDQALPILNQALGGNAPVITRIQALRVELATKEAAPPETRRRVELFM